MQTLPHSIEGLRKLLSLLGRASEELGSTLNIDETIERTCCVPVPSLADWSVVFLRDSETGGLYFANCCHRDRSAQNKMLDFFSKNPRNFFETNEITMAIRRGHPVFVNRTPDWEYDYHRVSHLLYLPLSHRKGVLGLICLGLDHPRHFSAEDVQIAEEISHRAAVAIDNAQIYQQTTKAEQELAGAVRTVEAASEAKSKFLADMSHEIRTPLGAILGFVDLLLEPDCSEEEKADWGQRVKTNGEHLLRLINDILNLSKVESGKLDLAYEPIELVPFVHDIESIFLMSAKNKGIDFKVHLLGPVPSIIKTDPTRLRQILTNIIGNAVKFTDKGFVTVGIQFVDNELNFIVTDTGQGLAPKQAAKLFRAFEQGDISHAKMGTGLGLVLARKLARLMGGDVKLLSSWPRRGSQFRVYIRPEIPASAKMIERLTYIHPVQKPFNPDHFRLDGKIILVVDDAQDNRVLLQRILTRQGASVLTACCYDEALDIVNKNRLDLVLMDIQMPGKDGYEATRELRQKGIQVPIIALTAHALPDEKEKTLKAGFNDHITKPFDRLHFLETIYSYLNFSLRAPH